MFVATLDTCVLWPSTQRDFLLSLAIEGVYRPTWSSAILEELEYHEKIKLQRIGHSESDADSRSRQLIRQMRTAFPDAEVGFWEPLEGTFGLPDSDDEHVLAAAVAAGAGALVTENLRDFPISAVPASIRVIPARDFAFDAVSIAPTRALSAVRELATRSGRHGPRLNEEQILDLLEHRYGMGDAVDVLRSLGGTGSEVS